MKLTIKVTKEILERSKMCGITTNLVNQNCAIALAVRDIFPTAIVENEFIVPFPKHSSMFYCFNESVDKIALPKIAGDFINDFDRLNPSDRVAMDEISFDVEITDNIINQINIDEIRPLLVNHPTLSLA